MKLSVTLLKKLPTTQLNLTLPTPPTRKQAILSDNIDAENPALSKAQELLRYQHCDMLASVLSQDLVIDTYHRRSTGTAGVVGGTDLPVQLVDLCHQADMSAEQYNALRAMSYSYAPRHIPLDNYSWFVDTAWVIHDATKQSGLNTDISAPPLGYVFHLVMNHRFPNSELALLRAGISRVCSSLDTQWFDKWDITVLGNDMTLLYPATVDQAGCDMYSVSIIFSRLNP